LMLVYLTDVRGERVVIIQVSWIGLGGAAGDRTQDRRIMRSLPSCNDPSSCTDSTPAVSNCTHRT
jgi:hypothetical protein